MIPSFIMSAKPDFPRVKEGLTATAIKSQEKL